MGLRHPRKRRLKIGTNYYFRFPESVDRHDWNVRHKYHIGKRSAAGWYCWDCGITLCKSGNEGVHRGHAAWYDHCPVCDLTIPTESLSVSSVGRELGFNRLPPQKKIGVASCSSFNWAVLQTALEGLTGKCIDDEYEDQFTLAEFQEILVECPIQYFDMIGTAFS